MVDIGGQCFRRFATSHGSPTHGMSARRCGKFWEIAAKMLRGWTEPLYQRTRDMYYRLHSARSHSAIETLFPSCRLVALLAQTTIYQLPIGWPGRFRPKQSVKERLSEATDGPPAAPAAAALRRLSHDRTTGTARGGAGNTVCRCSCDRVLTRVGTTLGRRRFGPFHTIVDILLRNFGPDAK